MKWSAWQLSARLAWGSWLYRILTVLTLTCVVLASTFFLLSVVPLGHGHGTLIVHYNVYLGIDDVRAWQWVFLLPVVWLVMSLVDLFAAFGLHRRDPHAAVSLLVLGFSVCVPWMMLFYYLIFMNR